MIGLRGAFLIASAVRQHENKVQEAVQEPESIVAKVAKSLGFNPRLLTGGVVVATVSTIGAVVYSLLKKQKEVIDNLGEEIEKDNTVRDTASPSDAVPQAINTTASAPVKQTIDPSPTPSPVVPQSTIPAYKPTPGSPTGILTIQSEAHGNSKLITNTKATALGLDSASYGAFQMTGATLKDYIANSKYGGKFSGLKPGTKEFTDRWTDLTYSNKGDDFLDDQRSFLYEKLVKPFVIKPLADKGILFSKLPVKTQEFLFSAAVNTPALAKRTIKSLKDNASASDLVIEISKARAEKYASNKIGIQKGLFDRLVKEADYTGVKLSLSEFTGPSRLALSKIIPDTTVSQTSSQPVITSVGPSVQPAQSVFRTNSGILVTS